VDEMVKRALALYDQLIGGQAVRAYKRWRKDRRNRKEMKVFNATAGPPIQIEPEDPVAIWNELERQRIMRGSGPGHGWRNY
jgi:hypothetical protein